MIRFVAIVPEREKNAVERLLSEALSSDRLKTMNDINAHCRIIAEMMASIHEGEWLVQVDHVAGLAIVRKHSRG